MAEKQEKTPLFSADPELLRLKQAFKLSRLPMQIKVAKTEEEMESEDDTHWVGYLRYPEIKELNMYNKLITDGDLFSALEEMVNRQWVTGDEIIKKDASIISSLQQVFVAFSQSRTVEIKKK
jgi:hypothetical protein